jgi:xanthosine utilization system XapX-like protein
MGTSVAKLGGLIVGLVFGWIWIHDSFPDAVLVALTGVLGYYAAAVLSGDIDIVEVLARRGQ